MNNANILLSSELDVIVKSLICIKSFCYFITFTLHCFEFGFII